jgi:hypothetical protein
MIFSFQGQVFENMEREFKPQVRSTSSSASPSALYSPSKEPSRLSHCLFRIITYSKGRRDREVFSIHPSRHPSMDGIIQGRKPWQK